jgi:hypothetical protein
MVVIPPHLVSLPLVAVAAAVIPLEMMVQDMPEVHQEDLVCVSALKLLAQ